MAGVATLRVDPIEPPPVDICHSDVTHQQAGREAVGMLVNEMRGALRVKAVARNKNHYGGKRVLLREAGVLLEQGKQFGEKCLGAKVLRSTDS